MKSFSFKSLIMFLIIIVLFSNNVNTCDSDDSETDGCDQDICENGGCITIEAFKEIYGADVFDDSGEAEEIRV